MTMGTFIICISLYIGHAYTLNYKLAFKAMPCEQTIEPRYPKQHVIVMNLSSRMNVSSDISFLKEVISCSQDRNWLEICFFGIITCSQDFLGKHLTAFKRKQ